MLGRTLFIGAGAMGGSILRGALKTGLLKPEEVFVTVHSEAHCQELAKELGVKAATSIPELGDFDMIILAVKPQVLPSVLPDLKNVSEKTTLLSVAAGITLATLEEALPNNSWYRAMPNTPVAVGAGMTAIASGSKGTEARGADVKALFEAIGEAVLVSEADLDRLGALSGAGPGYCFVIMDALADAGVRIGLPRALAIRAAAQTLLGAGLMAVNTGSHPAVLRDQVTSPGGTTIAGIAAMEAGGLRSAIQSGVVACYDRSNELGKKK